MTNVIIGIDYSYTSPSICILGENFIDSRFYFLNGSKDVCVERENYNGKHVTKKEFKSEVQRYDFISDWAMSVIKKYFSKDGCIIGLEGFSFGSHTGLVFNIAENGGLLKYKLFKELDYHPILIPPTSIKKFWTGKGNCNKQAMVDTLKSREGVDIVNYMNMSKLKSPAHDIVDSYAVARMIRGNQI